MNLIGSCVARFMNRSLHRCRTRGIFQWSFAPKLPRMDAEIALNPWGREEGEKGGGRGKILGGFSKPGRDAVRDSGRDSSRDSLGWVF